MKKPKQTTFDELVKEYYQGIVLFGVLMSAAAALLYEYHYSVTSDDLIGLVAACALFFGIVLIGQGIRGWRESEHFHSSFVYMKSREGKALSIKKKRKRKW